MCIRTFFMLSVNPLSGLKNAVAVGLTESISTEVRSDAVFSGDTGTSVVGWPRVPDNANSTRAIISTAKSRRLYMTTV